MSINFHRIRYQQNELPYIDEIYHDEEINDMIEKEQLLDKEDLFENLESEDNESQNNEIQDNQIQIDLEEKRKWEIFGEEGRKEMEESAKEIDAHYEAEKQKELLQKANYLRLFRDVKKMLKKNRVYNFNEDNIIIQNSVLGDSEVINQMTLGDLKNNEYIMFFDNNFMNYLKLAHNAIWNLQDNKLFSANIQALYYTYHPGQADDTLVKDAGKIFYTKGSDEKSMEDFDKDIIINDDPNDINPRKLRFPIRQEASGFDYIFLGYRIVYQTEYHQNVLLSRADLKLLKAYQPSSDRKFHELTTASTASNKLCIYETFMELAGKLQLKYTHRNTEKFRERIKKMLKKEGDKIECAVRNGELIKALELLTKKYNNEIIIVFYGSLMNIKRIEEPAKNNCIHCKKIYEEGTGGGMYDPWGIGRSKYVCNKCYDIMLPDDSLKNKYGELKFDSKIKPDNIDYKISLDTKSKLPIRVSQGLTMTLKKPKEIDELRGKKIMLYDDNKHVAPSVFKFTTNDKAIKTKEIIEHKYYLEPKYIDRWPDGSKNDKFVNKTKVAGIFGFDFETRPKKGSDVAEPFNATLVGHMKVKETNENPYGKGKKFAKSFYGEDSIKEFVKFLDGMSTKIDNSKSRPKKAAKTIYFYGFNNSRFDNLTRLYKELYYLDPSTEYQFANNSIKVIKYNNIRILDISLFYKVGDLRNTCKLFGLEKEKDRFPHKFVSDDTLYYKGKVPPKSYWNPGDYEAFVEKYGKNDFDLKKVCEKYCLLDSELTYELAEKHLINSRGEINGRYFNVEECITAANLAMGMFKQCFLTETLYQSPDHIVECEKRAYIGGRTEVFKKKFEVGKFNHRLYYYDINSSYPSCMRKIMPYKYIRKLTLNDKKIEYDNIKDHWLYCAKTKYTGNDPHFIPNILVRHESGNILAMCNTDYDYHWGNELKEAILNKCEVHVNEIIEYEGKELFKEFAEYFYEERLKVKNINAALSQFYKTVMNSLYGKFGQRTFDQTGIAKNMNDMYNQLKGDNKILIDVLHVEKGLNLFTYKELGTEYKCPGKLMRLASYITACGRCKLSKIMRDVGHENFYYCDTDSVFTTKKPSDKFIDKEILGLWKQETKSPIIEAYFIAKKTYYYKTEEVDPDTGKDEVMKAKAIRGERLDKESYIKMANGDSVSQTNTMFFRSYCGVEIRDQERRIEEVLTSRKFNGNNSRAWNNIEEWLENKICV